MMSLPLTVVASQVSDESLLVAGHIENLDRPVRRARRYALQNQRQGAVRTPKNTRTAELYVCDFEFDDTSGRFSRPERPSNPHRGSLRNHGRIGERHHLTLPPAAEEQAGTLK